MARILVVTFAFVATLLGAATARAQTNTFMVVGCDCGTWGGIVVYVDGEQIGTGAPQQVRAEVMPGRHQVKVDFWKGPFSHTTWFNGPVDVAGNTESRYQARQGGLDFVGKTQLARAPRPIRRGDLQDALEYVKDALDKSDDEPSRCASKVGNRLDELVDVLKDVLDDEDPTDGVGRALRKAKDASSLVEDTCPPRVARAIGKPLRRAIASLQGSSDRR